MTISSTKEKNENKARVAAEFSAILANNGDLNDFHASLAAYCASNAAGREKIEELSEAWNNLDNLNGLLFFKNLTESLITELRRLSE